MVTACVHLQKISSNFQGVQQYKDINISYS